MPSTAPVNDNLGKKRLHSSTPADGRNSLNRQTSLPQCFLQRVDGVSVSPYREAFSATPETPEFAPQGPQLEIQPFPTDILSEEILHLILFHVLAEPDFGKNGRWSSRDQAIRDKAQFAKAHRQWAALHRKFCLIHRSWTPFVLRSLYRSPKLTSKFAIKHLHHCLSHPETLWGVEVDETGKVVGGPVGDRRYFVQHLGFHTGTGREGSLDWIKYSGEWISFWATSLVTLTPRLRGWEVEGWCSRDCGEGGYQEHNQAPLYEVERLLPLSRISMSRIPSMGSLIGVVLSAYTTLRILEMLEISRNVFGEAESKKCVYRALRACPLESLAIKVAGGNRREGALDDVLETIPGIRHLHLAADCISPDFFHQELPKNLSQVLFGCATQNPIIFDGRRAVEELWQIGRTCAKPNSAYGRDTERYSLIRPDPSQPSAGGCFSDQLASLHQTFMHPSEEPPVQYEHEYLGRLQDELCRLDPALEPQGQAFDWENAFAYDVPSSAETTSPVGLEIWLIEQTGENGFLRDIQLQSSEAEHVAQSLCWRY